VRYSRQATRCPASGGAYATRRSLPLWSRETLISNCLNVFMGIFTNQTHHAITIGFEESSSSTIRGKKCMQINQEGFKGLQWGLLVRVRKEKAFGMSGDK